MRELQIYADKQRTDVYSEPFPMSAYRALTRGRTREPLTLDATQTRHEGKKCNYFND